MHQFRQFIHQLYPISDQTWESFNRLFREENLKKGDFFIQQGEIAKQIGFLEDGVMRAYYAADDGTEYNKHFFVNPCFVGGYASLITKQPNQIIQQALTDCTILVVDFGDFQQLFDQFPDLERVARRLAEVFFVAKEQKEIEIVMLDADKRYEIFKK